MFWGRCQFVVVVITMVCAATVFAQEALDAEHSPTPSEESSAPPEKSPAKSKKDGQEKPAKSLEETMRPEEFKAAGLDKLDEDELQHLDAWLQGYRHSTEKKATEKAEAKATEQISKANEQVSKANEEAKKASEQAAQAASTQRLDSLVSRVDGDFHGLTGRTMIKLEDGSVWKQANADDRYRSPVIDHPTAVVLHTTFGYKMRIEGATEFYVDPVVRPQ